MGLQLLFLEIANKIRISKLLQLPKSTVFDLVISGHASDRIQLPEER